jgi:transcriptional regulator with XRE-family HTH domain
MHYCSIIADSCKRIFPLKLHAASHDRNVLFPAAVSLREVRILLTGLDLRRFRKLIGLTQAEFAARMQLAQATLSQIEGGRIRLSHEHVQQARELFSAPEFSPSFDEFVKQLELGGLGAVPETDQLHWTVPVWAFNDTFDLARRPAPAEAVDLILVRAQQQPVIALRMERASDHWKQGELFVFARCGANDVTNGDVCLLHARGARGRPPRTILALARVLQTQRGQTYQFEPIRPGGPMLPADDAIQATFRAVYRGSYL